MSLAKVAQSVEKPPIWPQDTNLAFDTMLDVSEAEDANEAKDELKGVGELVIHVGDEPPVKKEFNFTLPLVPGGESQEEIAEPSEIHVEEPEEDIEVEEPDVFDWPARGGVPKFMEWLQGMMQSIPRHSGKDSSGLERAIAYLEALDKEISRAVRSDLKSELPVEELEKARDEIHRGAERCRDRLERIVANKYPKRKGNKKRGDVEQEGLVKEGQKAAGVQGRIVITVPLLISHVARICINGMVSAGKDIEDIFAKLAKKYDLSLREKAETVQLLSDMGYYIKNREVDFDKDFNPFSTENVEFIQQFPG